MSRRRARWKRYQDRIDPSRLVFIDETWAKTNMAPLRGWAPKGERLIGRAPHGHWRTMTFIAALRHNRIDAPAAQIPRALSNWSRLRFWPVSRPSSFFPAHSP
ncbi:hypothetical protein BG454_18500 [Roseinatronobacter bogoriensis subsp. barguzinensis]|uniref:Tc1-like transposase DDE domain-containing protein n=1 Tax=Roseinatronobacter bogoriensis subsp. barguzinensis TaxID=441209 RepID=A0A2K8KDR3_9RHOB|nr:hypothetical protein BG454_18500 [Rhodobaca barguzinensis]MBB4209938.1 hypothetical protein [Rhodobaca bogoriensis DSM 18756]